MSSPDVKHFNPIQLHEIRAMLSDGTGSVVDAVEQVDDAEEIEVEMVEKANGEVDGGRKVMRKEDKEEEGVDDANTATIAEEYYDTELDGVDDEGHIYVRLLTESRA